MTPCTRIRICGPFKICSLGTTFFQFISPTHLRRRIAFAVPCVLLLLAACQDPSGVGLNVIGEEGTDPNVIVVAVDTILIDEQDDLTGGLGGGLSPIQTRVLVGATPDALLGDVSANAYIDFRPPDTIPDGFRDRTIVSASLRLVRDYVYGDSTVMMPLELYRIDEEWSPVDAPSDTTFEIGAQLATLSIMAADSVVAINLPAAWVTEFDETLRSDSAITAIDGFQLRLMDGAIPGAVVGYDTNESTLRVITAEDTVDYPLAEVFTHLERGEGAIPPPDRIVLRDGANETVAFTFPLEDFEGVGLANATIRFSVDPSYLDEAGFTRRIPTRMLFYGRNSEGARTPLADASLDEDTNTFSFSSSVLTTIIQQALVGNVVYDRFEITIPSSPVRLEAIPIILGPPPAEGEADRRPRIALTFIPLPT